LKNVKECNPVALRNADIQQTIDHDERKFGGLPRNGSEQFRFVPVARLEEVDDRPERLETIRERKPLKDSKKGRELLPPAVIRVPSGDHFGDKRQLTWVLCIRDGSQLVKLLARCLHDP
jgi:hypothetical protein